MMAELEELQKRVDRIEEAKEEEILTLVELLSNIAFFGKINRDDCTYSKNGQCGFFTLESEEENKIPIVSKCRIPNCDTAFDHYHIEASDITCTLCQNHKRPEGSSSNNQTTENGYLNR